MKEILEQTLELFERFMPKNIAVDDRKQLAMYEAYHKIKQLHDATQQQQPAGLRWVDAKKDPPVDSDNYHVKVLDKDGDGYVFPAVLCFTMGMWEVMEDHHEVIEWLDESAPSPLQEAVDAVDVLNWLLGFECPATEDYSSDKIIICDGDFYWSRDEDGDHPMDGNDILRLFLQSKNKPK